MSKRLLALLLAAAAMAYSGLAAAGTDWVAHVSRAGPDQAPAGQSRFDDLFRAADGTYDIPYPFEALLAHLESAIDNGRHHGVRQVLIPHGRSLQRDAAAPHFFRFPRVVAALQGEPGDAPDTPRLVLEYRLFVAHQPRSHSLEIISYNDEAGRFEFQVVDDYREGGAAQVRPANRAMCLGCHQNAAPIFATRPWSETNFNFRIARRLSEVHPQRYDSFVDALGGDADAIDLLTERANYLAVAQLVWQRGCARAECRAAVLRALLQYRLSGKSGFDREHAGYREHYLADLRRNWKRNWPNGLALANSRIVDRDPLDGAMPTRSEDPLAPRPPHAHWTRFDAVLADGIVARLSGFLSQADMRRIDRHLVQESELRTHPRRDVSGRCRLAHVSTQTRLLECSGDTSSDAPRARIELDYRNGEPHSLHVLSLQLPGDPGILQPTLGAVNRLQDGIRAELRNDGGISMRLANGERLQSLELRWQDPELRGDIGIRLSLTDDFELIDNALQAMLRDDSLESFDNRPFRRRIVLDELGHALGTTLQPVSTQALVNTAPAPDSQQAQRSVAATPHGDLVLLQAHCGQCHAADTRQPPGFLYGADANQRITQCAPRILARLQAWQRNANDQVVPMPPPASVAASWHEGEPYHRLVEALEGLLEREGGHRRVDSRIAAYRELDACLPES